MKGRTIKFMNVRLKGGNDNVVNKPRINGIKYNVKNRLFKNFSLIYNLKIFFFNYVHFYKIFIFFMIISK